MSILNDVMREASQRLFPGVEVSSAASFAPMRDLERGDFSSSVAIEIARAIKQDASTIANRLIGELVPHVPGEWHSEAGYVVCAHVPRRVWIEEIALDAHHAVKAITGAAAADSAQEIACILPDVTEPLYARVRLLARVTLHSLLVVATEGRCRLWLHPHAPIDALTQADVVGAFRKAVEWALSHEDEERVGIPQDLKASLRGVRCVWTSHHYHERLPHSDKSELSRAKQSGVLDLRMPSDAWLLSRNRGLSSLLERKSLEKVIQQLPGDQGWRRFLFHAASTVFSGDFDPAVALFDEFASPLYSAQALCERYVRLAPEFPLPVGREEAVSTVREMERDRSLILRGLFMPLYTARAVARGEVTEWCEVFEDMLHRGHRFLNTPQTRLDLAQGRESGGTPQILASLGFGLSSILPFVAEGS